MLNDDGAETHEAARLVKLARGGVGRSRFSAWDGALCTPRCQLPAVCQRFLSSTDIAYSDPFSMPPVSHSWPRPRAARTRFCSAIGVTEINMLALVPAGTTEVTYCGVKSSSLPVVKLVKLSRSPCSKMGVPIKPVAPCFAVCGRTGMLARPPPDDSGGGGS